MKKKGGFTLIELLAIIVILGIIALLIVPAVTDVITDSEKDIALRGAENYLKAAELPLIRASATTTITNGVYSVMNGGNICIGTKNASANTCTGTLLEVKIDGGTLSDGRVKIVDNQIIDYSLKIEDYIVDYDATIKGPKISSSTALKTIS